jgi:hypothetical protein
MAVTGGCASTGKNNYNTSGYGSEAHRAPTGSGLLIFLGDLAGAAAGVYLVEKELEYEHELLEQQGKITKKLMKKFH